MSKIADLEAKLDKLTRRQCHILYLVCHGKTLKEIGREIGYKLKTIEAEMTVIYKLFDLDKMTREEKRRVLLEEVCPIHSLRIQDPQKDCTDQVIEPEPPKPDPAMLALVVRDAETGLYPLHRDLIPVSERRMTRVEEPPLPTVQPRRGSCLPWVLVGILSFLLIAALALLVEFYWALTTIGTPTLAPVAFATVIVTAPPAPSSPTLVATQPPAATFTLAPIWTPSPIPNTPTLSLTLVPTPKPSPTPSLKLPFTDSFNRSVRPEWLILEGQPVIVNNELKGTGGGVTLGLMHNYNPYVVNFDFASSGGQYGRVTITLGNLMKYDWNRWGSAWQGFDGQRWVDISAGEPINLTGHFRLAVDGSTYGISFNGKPIPEVTYGTRVTGPLELNIANETGIKNFSMTAQ